MLIKMVLFSKNSYDYYLNNKKYILIQIICIKISQVNIEIYMYNYYINVEILYLNIKF